MLSAVAAYELARRAIHPSWPVAARHAYDVLALERRLGLAWEAPLQRALLSVMPAFDVVYLVAQFGVTAVFFVWLYRARPEVYVRFRNAFVVATALALLVAWRYPVAPPRLVGLRDVLHLSVASVTDPLAAMPSLHAGWAVGVGAGVWAPVARPRGRVPRARRRRDGRDGQPLRPGRRRGRVADGLWLRLYACRLAESRWYDCAASRGGAVR